MCLILFFLIKKKIIVFHVQLCFMCKTYIFFCGCFYIKNRNIFSIKNITCEPAATLALIEGNAAWCLTSLSQPWLKRPFLWNVPPAPSANQKNDKKPLKNTENQQRSKKVELMTFWRGLPTARTRRISASRKLRQPQKSTPSAVFAKIS